ncbi:MAG TPA: FAD-dependent oxidoreductase [archaeon]|nr:FAD-dependent oxidoreductase [archaeon]
MNKEFSARFVIIGAGLAGAATAYWLARLGETAVLILEQENQPGMHSSGRNAGMIRQLISDKEILSLAREGAKFFDRQAQDLEEPVPFSRTGSILAAGGERWKALLEEAERAGQVGVELEIWDSGRVNSLVPCTEGGIFEGGVFCPRDGVTDTDRLINMLLKAAQARGVRLVTGCAARGIEVQGAGIRGVETNQGFINTETVINASGPWAAIVGAMAGALPIPFAPLRRHLYYTGALSWVDPRWPFVWDVGVDVYFRPESAGLLLSPCDESEVKPGTPTVDPEMQDLLAAKLSASFPRLLEVPIARTWAGIRTFAPDRRFVIGWDPKIEGFYWVAGLGGHGVTTSPAVGELAARELCSAPGESSFSPKRFL